MADSIREKIVADLITTLKSIRTDNGYQFKFSEIYRLPRSGFNVRGYPACLVVEVGEDKTDGVPMAYTTCTLHMQFICWNRKTNNASEESIKVLANVEKALKVDITRGGNAYDTNITTNEMILAEELLPNGGVIVNFDVLYRHNIADPFTIGA